MHLSRIRISNFRNFSELDVSLGGNVVVVGENRVGKSNLLYALRLLAFGEGALAPCVALVERPWTLSPTLPLEEREGVRCGSAPLRRSRRPMSCSDS